MRPSRLTSARDHPSGSPVRVISHPSLTPSGSCGFKVGSGSADEREVVQITSVMKRLLGTPGPRRRLHAGRAHHRDGDPRDRAGSAELELRQRHGPTGEPDPARAGVRECEGGAAATPARRPLRGRRDVRRAERLRRLHVDTDGVERPEPRRLVPRRDPRGCRLVRRSVVHDPIPWLDDTIRSLSIPRDESHRLRRRHRLDVRDQLPRRAAGRLADELGCRRELWERHPDELGRKPLADGR